MFSSKSICHSVFGIGRFFVYDPIMQSQQPKFAVNYCKIKKIDVETLEKYSQISEKFEYSEDLETESQGRPIEYSPFSIDSLQCYHPNYNIFFEMNANNYDSVAFNHKYHIIDLQTVKDSATGELHKRNIFIKFSPLLDPIRYLIGKYESNSDRIGRLPKYDSNPSDIMPKYLNTQNVSYTDNFFYYLSSQLANTHDFPNAVDYYGSFLGIQRKYRFDVVDDLEYLNQSPFFRKNRGKLFEVETKMDPFANFGSRANKNRISIKTDACDPIDLGLDTIEGCAEWIQNGDNQQQQVEESKIPIELDVCDQIEISVSDENTQMIRSYNSASNSGSESNSSSVSTNSLVNYTSSEDGEDDPIESQSETESASEFGTISESSNYSEEALYAYIHNFPVQLICLEKCDGTLDDLFIRDEIDEKIGAAALMQIVMTLITYNKCFAFTHNDLHTNNIMYSNCKEEYLIYRFGKKLYRVPTYGRIFKIIDFGRAIYKFGDRIWCSDSFDVEGDASDQYNTEPFFKEGKKRIDPNPSFDLCRLGCSIYNFVLDIDVKVGDMDDFQKTIYRWCQDDAGKNVLYKTSGEERYPDFKLYKMIARTVHKHTADAQLDFPLFKQFIWKPKGSKSKGHIIIDIDELPVYYG